MVSYTRRNDGHHDKTGQAKCLESCPKFMCGKSGTCLGLDIFHNRGRTTFAEIFSELGIIFAEVRGLITRQVAPFSPTHLFVPANDGFAFLFGPCYHALMRHADTLDIVGHLRVWVNAHSIT